MLNLIYLLISVAFGSNYHKIMGFIILPLKSQKSLYFSINPIEIKLDFSLEYMYFLLLIINGNGVYIQRL